MNLREAVLLLVTLGQATLAGLLVLSTPSVAQQSNFDVQAACFGFAQDVADKVYAVERHERLFSPRRVDFLATDNGDDFIYFGDYARITVISTFTGARVNSVLLDKGRKSPRPNLRLYLNRPVRKGQMSTSSTRI